jgi:hypothetical protein
MSTNSITPTSVPPLRQQPLINPPRPITNRLSRCLNLPFPDSESVLFLILVLFASLYVAHNPMQSSSVVVCVRTTFFGDGDPGSFREGEGVDLGEGLWVRGGGYGIDGVV